MMEGCHEGKQSGNDSDILITIDVRANYQKKELILQDLMDVEYIELETSDDFLSQGRVLDIGKDILLVSNYSPDGDIFVFDRNGKGISKFNHQGQGNEEYIYIYGAVLDEDNGEILINDVRGRKILAYDLYGNFKRSIRHYEKLGYVSIYNYDSKNLICEADDDGKTSEKMFVIISKLDGSVINKMPISYKQHKTTMVAKNNGIFHFYPYSQILPFHDSWIISEASSDTVFRFLPDFSMIPFITRTPSIQSMNPEIFLFPKILTDLYYFMEIVKKEDYTDDVFTRTDLIYDRQERVIYEYTLCNDDYSNKQQVNINMATSGTKNGEIAFWQIIEAHTLVESYKKGELKGKLKEISAELEEDSNPVIMLVKHKTSKL